MERDVEEQTGPLALLAVVVAVSVAVVSGVLSVPRDLPRADGPITDPIPERPIVSGLALTLQEFVTECDPRSDYLAASVIDYSQQEIDHSQQEDLMGVRARRALVALGVAATAMALIAAVPATGSAGERKQVSTDYTLVRSGPHQFVIATAYRGDTIDVQQEQSGGYRWGRVYGGIDICAWTFGGALSQGPATQDACRHDPPRSVEGFTNGQIGSNSAGNDGAPARFTPTAPGCNTYPDGSVPGFGNVKPWLVPAQPADQLANVSMTAADRVLWRYVSKDGGWVMVRVPKFGDTDGAGAQSWMFVQRACLTW